MPERGPVSAGFVVTGRSSWRMTIDGDGIGDAVPGPVGEGETDLLFTLPPDDATAVADGSLGLDEAFMRGRTKMVGSSGTFMAVLPVLRSDEWRAACRELLVPAPS